MVLLNGERHHYRRKAAAVEGERRGYYFETAIIGLLVICAPKCTVICSTDERLIIGIVIELVCLCDCKTACT